MILLPVSDAIIPFSPFQGVVLEVSLLDPPVVTELSSAQCHSSEHRKNALWVALDEVQDPQNLGAIIRTCVFFGVDGIVTTENRSAPLNATVSKASAGALEVAPIYHPGNLSAFLEGSKRNGWRIVGTSLDEGVKTQVDSHQLTMDAPTILVLGNEAKGIREKVKSSCDLHVKLASVGTNDSVASLNVSVAAALLIHPLATQESNSTL